MKIDFRLILVDHFHTLRNATNGKVNWWDIFVLYCSPFAVSGLSYYFCLNFDRDVISVSLTFFGIFLALMLNIQVAIFSVFQRSWRFSEDERIRKSQQDYLKMRRDLLKELNATISYLSLFCVLATCLFLVMFILKLHGRIESAISVYVFAHFILMFLIVAKRAHILFKKEYDFPS